MYEVLRQEKKLLATIEDYNRYTQYFSRVMQEDKYNGKDGYCIRFLYFDSLKDNDVQESRKMRLRNYGADCDFAILEMKQKQGDMQKKRYMRLSKEDALALIAGKYSVLLKYRESFAAECYALMRKNQYHPKTIIECRRKSFTVKENNIRVTFDHHVVCTESDYDIFSSSLVQYPSLDPQLVMLEIKYNRFLLGNIKDMINKLKDNEIMISQYFFDRTIINHYKY